MVVTAVMTGVSYATSAEIAREERRSGLRTIRRVIPYLWPDGQAWVKRRVVIAMALLLVAKLIAVGTPILYKQAVDSLSGEVSDLMLGAVGLTIAYGAARLGNVGFQQRHAYFTQGIFYIVFGESLRGVYILMIT
mgnify:CR=1 FL=1